MKLGKDFGWFIEKKTSQLKQGPSPREQHDPQGNRHTTTWSVSATSVTSVDRSQAASPIPISRLLTSAHALAFAVGTTAWKLGPQHHAATRHAAPQVAMQLPRREGWMMGAGMSRSLDNNQRRLLKETFSTRCLKEVSRRPLSATQWKLPI